MPSIHQEIAAYYGGNIVGDQVVIPTDGHSHRDRGTSIKIDPRAPGGALVYCFNGSVAAALAVKDMLRRDGFLGDEGTSASSDADLARRRTISDGQAEKRKVQREAALHAEDILCTAKPANPDHPYLVRKGIPPERLWQQADDLLVPMSDPSGFLWNLQRIAPDGSKRFLPGGRTKGLFWFAGEPRDVICIGEGMATMAAVRRATGYNVIAAMSAANLPTMARIAQERSPSVQLLIAADDDAAGMKAAREAVALTGALIVRPRELSHD